MENLPRIPRLVFKNPEEGLDKAKTLVVSKKYLANTLNFINFQDWTILVNFKHSRYGRTISLYAKPQPCLGNQVDCFWVDPGELSRELRAYQFQNILVADGKEVLLVTPEEVTFSENLISFRLPETCSKITSRLVRRHLCDGIKVQLIQSSAVFFGSLYDFNSVSFRVEVNAVPPQTFQWINPKASVIVSFISEDKTLYSSECKIVRYTDDSQKRTFVLEPLHQHIQRFKPKKFRSTRQELVPSPNIIFKHPLTRQIIDLKVVNISGTGFSVEEDPANAMLLPGMIISDLELNFANTFKIKCQAQVIYRIPWDENEENKREKCGLAILDMDIQDHVKLLALLQQAKNRNFYMCNMVNMEALWNFFFTTGFIYPEKYAYIQANKERFKNTYEKLYTQSPSIARHFIYQENGTIHGHIAALRFYEKSWLLHHHAASRSATQRAGLMVLNQLGRFINDSHTLHSVHMNFVMCYFRPENKFPARIFGGIAQSINDPKACSLDTFAYFHYKRNFNVEWDLSSPWELTKTRKEDLLDLESFYRNESDGLMLNALDLVPDLIEEEQLEDEYNKIGFKREKHLFSLKKDRRLKAIILFNIADVGLNMSELTNCITVFVLDKNDLPKDTLYLMLSLLCLKFGKEQIPVLIFPSDYAKETSIAYDKLYQLWVLSMNHTDHYFKYLKNLLKSIQH